jgi:restriction system protein
MNSIEKAIQAALSPSVRLLWLLVFVLWLAAGLTLWLRKRREAVRLHGASLADLDRMDGETFERYLAVLFRSLGYTVEVTSSQGDFGGDLLLWRDGEKNVVQAKRWQRSVGVKAVQEVLGAKGYYACQHAWVVTNATFTPAARELAARNEVRLWERSDLVRAREQTETSGAAQSVSPSYQEATGEGEETAPGNEAGGLVPACARCGRPLTIGVVTYCRQQPERFGGQLLCYACHRGKRKAA